MAVPHSMWDVSSLTRDRCEGKVKVSQLYLTLCDPMDYTVHGILQAKITGVGSLSLLQEIFPTQRSNPGLQHCRWILYQLRHKGSPRILEWGAYTFSSRSSWPRNQNRAPALQVDFLPTELSGKPNKGSNLHPLHWKHSLNHWITKEVPKGCLWRCLF